MSGRANGGGRGARADAGRCPTCGAARGAPPSNAYFPFCTPRCRAADLGKWLAGDYVISTPLREDDDGGGAPGDA